MYEYEEGDSAATPWVNNFLQMREENQEEEGNTWSKMRAARKTILKNITQLYM